MHEPRHTDRRTVLKAIPATVVGGSILSGAAGAARGGARGSARGSTNEIVIVAAEHDDDADEHQFELSTDELTAGWTTFVFDNRTDHTHFAYLGKLPQDAIDAADEEGADLLDFYVEHVTRPFQWLMDDIDPARDPDSDDLSDTYSDLEEGVLFPPWFEEVLPSGGVGFTSGHTTSTTTVALDPGEYIAECYVKDENGEFHSYNGMIALVSVAGERSGTELRSTLDLSLSTGGIDVERNVRPGRHTVAVRFEDQQVYEHLLGHDVHLIRFDEATTVDDVNGWMNWMDPDGLVSDGDEPGTFLGGTQTILTPELLEGEGTETAYFHVNLNPGTYAWVSEVPAPDDNGFLEPFVVPFGRD